MEGSGYENFEDYILFYSGDPKHNRSRAGVTVAVHKRLKPYLTSWEEIDERLMKIELKLWDITSLLCVP